MKVFYKGLYQVIHFQNESLCNGYVCYNHLYSINCEIKDTENIVNKNQPIKPCIIAKYLGNPLIGISPKPSVVKVLMDNIKAFNILIKMSYTTAMLKIRINKLDFQKRLCFVKSDHLPFITSIRFKRNEENTDPDFAHFKSNIDVEVKNFGTLFLDSAMILPNALYSSNSRCFSSKYTSWIPVSFTMYFMKKE